MPTEQPERRATLVVAPRQDSVALAVARRLASAEDAVAVAWLGRGDVDEVEGISQFCVESTGAYATDLIERAAGILGGVTRMVRLVPSAPARPVRDLDRPTAQAQVGILSDVLTEVQAATLLLPRDGTGSVTLVGPVDGLHAYHGRVTAAIVGAGLVGLTRALAVELADVGVRVNHIAVGPMEAAPGAPPADGEGARRMLLRSPSHRLVRRESVADAVAWVSGAHASFMTGATLRVDGGWAALNSATIWSAPDGSMAWTS